MLTEENFSARKAHVQRQFVRKTIHLPKNSQGLSRSEQTTEMLSSMRKLSKI